MQIHSRTTCLGHWPTSNGTPPAEVVVVSLVQLPIIMAPKMVHTFCVNYALINWNLPARRKGRSCTVKFNSGDEWVSVLVMHTSAMPLVRAVWQGGGRLISLHSVWWYLLSLPSSGIFMNFTVAVQLKVQFLLAVRKWRWTALNWCSPFNGSQNFRTYPWKPFFVRVISPPFSSLFA